MAPSRREATASTREESRSRSAARRGWGGGGALVADGILRVDARPIVVVLFEGSLDLVLFLLRARVKRQTRMAMTVKTREGSATGGRAAEEGRQMHEQASRLLFF
eukprot:scaffold183982_cov27-Tisochrysis_lutea.AAC.2